MHVEIFFTANEMEDQQLRGKTAVVIDTLRATSTIVTALYNGAKAVEPTVEVAEAFRRGKELSAGTYVIGGEREGLKVEGFDLGNSPRDYLPPIVEGKTVILSTTNGTNTIRRARAADYVLIGSLLNAQAIMEEAVKIGKDLVLCCSGTKGHFSLEDFVTAGAMVERLQKLGVEVKGDDRVSTARLLYERYTDQNELAELVSCSQNGMRLVEIGLSDDIDYCIRQDSKPVVCYFDGQSILAETIYSERFCH